MDEAYINGGNSIVVGHRLLECVSIGVGHLKKKFYLTSFVVIMVYISKYG